MGVVTEKILTGTVEMMTERKTGRIVTGRMVTGRMVTGRVI